MPRGLGRECVYLFRGRTGRDRVYFLLKIFANTEIPLQEIEKMTIEAVTAGEITVSFNGVIQVMHIPKCICVELLA